MRHISVLQREVLKGLALKPDHVVFDATFGSGGYAEAITAELGASGTYIGVDVDHSAFTALETYPLSTEATTHFVTDNFRNLTSIIDRLGIDALDAVVADLGWRSEQFALGNRGLSFQNDEPLLMTLGDPADYMFIATDIVNEWAEDTLADIIFGYADERYARRIARAIVVARALAPITTTNELCRVIESALPRSARHGSIHPATKTFQALRIAVNDELRALEALIDKGFAALKTGGRLAIVTFHSIEDRIVKHAFRQRAQENVAELITKRPIVPERTEILKNPRARSAKLRIIHKVANYETFN